MSIERCEVDCARHTGEAYLVRIVGLGISDQMVLCQAARDERRANGFKVEAIEPLEEEKQPSRPRVRRPVPLRLSWRLDALNKLVADLAKIKATLAPTIGRSNIDARGISAVQFLLGRAIEDARRIRDGVGEDVDDQERGDDEDLAVLVTKEARS